MANTEDPRQRWVIVEEVRRLMEEKYPGDWNDRCPDVACHTVYVLRAYGLTGYRIAAGRVQESDGDPPPVLYKGEHRGTGKSQYHTWVVGPSGEKLDFSVEPIRYGKDYLWEPYEPLPRLTCTATAETTEAVR